MNNNLFDFATKELSQDAVLCWILNWVNYPENELHELGCSFFSEINGSEIKDGERINVLQQKEKADIVVVVPSIQKIIIIEDKVYSTEHDNQIEKYKDCLSNIVKQRSVLNIDTETPYSVSTVYLKTGFFYDDDRLVRADIIIDGEKLYSIISNPCFQGKSEILDSYVIFLRSLLDWYELNGDYSKCDNGYYLVSSESYPQYKLMRFIFPEHMWTDKTSNAYKVYGSSSSGRPWTELEIAPSFQYSDSEDSFALFWRIDTAKRGPYLSFRFYEDFNKADEKKTKRHSELYSKLKFSCERIISKENRIGILWDDVNDGYRGSYKESSIFTIYLATYLDKWDEKGELFAEYIRNVTKEILLEIENIDF